MVLDFEYQVVRVYELYANYKKKTAQNLKCPAV